MTDYLERFRERGIEILNELPPGWRYLENTNTAPQGYRWACNNKSIRNTCWSICLLLCKQ